MFEIGINKYFEVRPAVSYFLLLSPAINFIMTGLFYCRCDKLIYINHDR